MTEFIVIFLAVFGDLLFFSLVLWSPEVSFLPHALIQQLSKKKHSQLKQLTFRTQEATQ